jgi:4-hydroxyphenylacetate 3-monooxygenase
LSRLIRGAQMLGTASVMSDYVLATVILPLKPGDEDYAISCVVPNGAPGLKLYPRRPYALGPTSVFDYPMSSRFDETDSLVVFDDVFLPWEEVFVYKNLELTAGQFSVTAAHVLGNTQSHIRSLAKLEFLVGLVKGCMDLSGRSAGSEMVAQLGELAARVSLGGHEGMILGCRGRGRSQTSLV